MKYKIREILNRFDDLIIDPKPNKLVNEFYQRIILKSLEFYMKWIDKRLELISDEKVKNELIIIKEYMGQIKTYIEKAAKIIYPLQELSRKLSQVCCIKSK